MLKSRVYPEAGLVERIKQWLHRGHQFAPLRAEEDTHGADHVDTDPGRGAFTAISCISRLRSALGHLGTRRPAPTRLSDEHGNLRAIVDTTSFAGYADSAFNQIRQNAGASVAVLIRLLEGIASVAERIDDEEGRVALREHATLVLEDGERALQSGREQADLRTSHAAAIKALGRGNWVRFTSG